MKIGFFFPLYQMASEHSALYFIFFLVFLFRTSRDFFFFKYAVCSSSNHDPQQRQFILEAKCSVYIYTPRDGVDNWSFYIFVYIWRDSQWFSGYLWFWFLYPSFVSIFCLKSLAVTHTWGGHLGASLSHGQKIGWIAYSKTDTWVFCFFS